MDFQRNYISEGINNADLEDMIIISDIDEIPNLNKIDLKKTKKKIKMKFNFFLVFSFFVKNYG